MGLVAKIQTAGYMGQRTLIFLLEKIAIGVSIGGSELPGGKYIHKSLHILSWIHTVSFQRSPSFWISNEKQKSNELSKKSIILIYFKLTLLIVPQMR